VCDTTVYDALFAPRLLATAMRTKKRGMESKERGTKGMNISVNGVRARKKAEANTVPRETVAEK
jgi:hypothetical protein